MKSRSSDANPRRHFGPRLARVAGAVALVAAVQAAYESRADEYGQNTLRGVRLVAVTVDLHHAPSQLPGLSEENVRTDVELRLRSAGLRVVPIHQLEGPGAPIISVGIDGLFATMEGEAAPSGLFTALALGVHQAARLTRNPKIQVAGSTWTTRMLLQGPATAAEAEAIRANLRDMVDQFLNAWLEQNPERATSKDGGGRQ